MRRIAAANPRRRENGFSRGAVFAGLVVTGVGTARDVTLDFVEPTSLVDIDNDDDNNDR